MKNVKFQKIHRQLRPKGAPARKLTWEAIEQIRSDVLYTHNENKTPMFFCSFSCLPYLFSTRFLKRESPEEWTIQRLATGFSVTPDVICRILCSKFNPNPERKLRQDTMVLAKQQQQTLGDGTKVRPSLLPRSSTPATLPPGTTGALVVAQKSQEMAKVDSKKVSLGPSKLSSTLSTAHAITTIPTHQKDDIVASETSEKFEEDGEKEEDYSEDEGENEEVWDGVTFSDAELQDFAQTMTEKHIPVEKRGKEYFDSKGNFLYRI